MSHNIHWTIAAAVCCACLVYYSNSAPLNTAIYLCQATETPKELITRGQILQPAAVDTNYTFTIDFVTSNNTNITCINVTTTFGDIELISQVPNLTQVEFVIVPDPTNGIDVTVELYADATNTTVEEA